MSVEKHGEEMTYDICCDAPYHNFVANGIVVHNSGKTVIGHTIAKIMETTIPDLEIGWIAMRRNLLTQAKEENEDKIGVKNIHYLSMFDKRMESMHKARQDGKKILLVVDEAQHDAASTMAAVHNVLKPEYILGLTATPFRTDKVKLCFDKVVKDAGIHQLIQEGFLSQYNHYTIGEWSIRRIVEHYVREPEVWGRSIFYFLTLDECFEFQREVEKHSESILKRLAEKRPDMSPQKLSEVVTGSSSESDREEQLKLFRAGHVPVLVNCMVLTEGFDDPYLETAWVRDSSRGPTMQMAGRAFRMHPGWKSGGDERFKFKNIVQSKNSRYPIIKTALPAQQYVWQSDEWLSLTVNPRLAEMQKISRMAIASADVELPKFVLDRQKRKRGRITF